MKMSNAELEGASLLCQFLVSVIQELEEALPVQPLVIEKQLVQQLLDGDMNLEMEIQGALSDKKSEFSPRDLPSCKKIISQHVANAEATLEKLGKTPAGAIQPSEIERQAFDLAISSMKHDLDVFRMWLTRSKDRDAAIYHQNLSWKLSRQSRAREYADFLLTRTSSNWLIELETLETPTQGLKAVQNTLKHIARLEYVGQDRAQVLCLLNWAAPNLFEAHHQRNQAGLLGGLVNSTMNPCVGLALVPSFGFKKGKLHVVENQCYELLASMNVNLDHTAVLPFQGRTDERETRPLVQILRVLLAMQEDALKMSMEAWRSRALLRKQLLQEAEL